MLLRITFQCNETDGACFENTNCRNTIGSFECSCKSGFISWGRRHCKDIDECAKDNPCPRKEKFTYRQLFTDNQWFGPKTVQFCTFWTEKSKNAKIPKVVIDVFVAKKALSSIMIINASKNVIPEKILAIPVKNAKKGMENFSVLYKQRRLQPQLLQRLQPPLRPLQRKKSLLSLIM